MNDNRIKRILDCGYKAVLVATGGGSSALNELLITPGASRFVADAQIPYSPDALFTYLGEEVGESCSPATARKLADAAFEQSSKYSISNIEYHPAGIACTAALSTDRERRGADRAFICIKTKKANQLYALHFSKASRQEQEALLRDGLLVLIAQALGAERGLMLPGSFNPVHQGHCNLLKAVEEMTGLRGVFELSCANVDKSEQPADECLKRVSRIKDIPVALTNAPRFVQKAELFPKTTFVLGYDTAARLIDYATDDEWVTFQSLETMFFIAGRIFQGLESIDAVSSLRTAAGGINFQGLENLELPKGFEKLFEKIPELKFREDISSTSLRS